MVRTSFVTPRQKMHLTNGSWRPVILFSFENIVSVSSCFYDSGLREFSASMCARAHIIYFEVESMPKLATVSSSTGSSSPADNNNKIST